MPRLAPSLIHSAQRFLDARRTLSSRSRPLSPSLFVALYCVECGVCVDRCLCSDMRPLLVAHVALLPVAFWCSYHTTSHPAHGTHLTQTTRTTRTSTPLATHTPCTSHTQHLTTHLPQMHNPSHPSHFTHTSHPHHAKSTHHTRSSSPFHHHRLVLAHASQRWHRSLLCLVDALCACDQIYPFYPKLTDLTKSKYTTRPS